ncbi:conserved hypothetical protein [Trichinella spiralis]|uniref:hypothetical protein n=1 Tax=Trichinella spiralis TaxID=6334 RepID=UPI0001EFBF0F|nr:conserved hypothetical protein [Trichinella spiralis]
MIRKKIEEGKEPAAVVRVTTPMARQLDNGRMTADGRAPPPTRSAGDEMISSGRFSLSANKRPRLNQTTISIYLSPMNNSSITAFSLLIKLNSTTPPIYLSIYLSIYLQLTQSSNAFTQTRTPTSAAAHFSLNKFCSKFSPPPPPATTTTTKSDEKQQQ